ncbi:MAG TPA: peroxiredoxin [Pirellulales bacterium]|jgi:peroxiredoxin Q/BCP|nr:peroxiredoxin [Pirellulales bacterium]
MARAAGLRVGDVAPDFARTAADGKLIRLSDFRDRQHVVLYFYPRDHTAICTAQACEFRDRYAEFSADEAVVIGVSGNSLPSHRQFAETHALPFSLLSDADGSLRRLYGVENRLWLIPQRATFVIDKRGIVRLVFVSLWQGPAHAEQAIGMLRRLKAEG